MGSGESLFWIIYESNLLFKSISVKILAMINLDQFKITPKEISGTIVEHVRARRKEAHLTQEQLSGKSGVSLGSIKRFERTGEISLSSLIRISVALDCQEDFLQLFVKKQYQSIQEILDEQC